MADVWSREENAAIVADYFAMLQHELRAERYNKAEHNRRLQPLLHGRSSQSIEFKHANISAVLIELGFPYIDGYKPRGNYQDSLREEVTERLAHDTQLSISAAAVVDAPAQSPPAVSSLADVIVKAPIRNREPREYVYERHREQIRTRARVNYLEIEVRNASLGRAGELFALEVEHRRLWEAGCKDLAERIEHVSQTQGDGLGYDIHSFETNGGDRLVEVKATAFGSLTPFFATRHEVEVSETRDSDFKLYRVFKFREAPQLFVLPGSLKESCVLEPITFRASLPNSS